MASGRFCTMCGVRPRPKDDVRLTCVPCTELVEEELAERKARQRDRPNSLTDYRKVLHWKGHLIGFPPTDPSTGMFRPAYVDWRDDNVDRVPASKLIDLGVWQPDFTQKQIDNFKDLFYQANCLGLKVRRTKVAA